MKIQKRAFICLCASALIMAFALVMSLCGHGINYGIDFAGGLNIQYNMGAAFEQKPDDHPEGHVCFRRNIPCHGLIQCGVPFGIDPRFGCKPELTVNRSVRSNIGIILVQGDSVKMALDTHGENCFIIFAVFLTLKTMKNYLNLRINGFQSLIALDINGDQFFRRFIEKT